MPKCMYMNEKEKALIDLSSTDWRDIVFRLKKGDSVLVLGPGAITDENGYTLYDNLCSALEEELNIKGSHSHYRLFKLSERLKKQRAGESILMETVEKVYKSPYICKTTEKLAQIPFPLIISTTGDHVLKRAFEEQAIPHNSAFYNFNSTPGEVDPPHVDKPLIYQLFGSIEEEDSLLLTHDNLYDFLFAILGSKQLPIEIRDELRNARNFIFLGFDFEEWYLQIIMRLFEIHNEKNSYAYAWHELNEETISFYSNKFKLDFINGHIHAFVDELHKRCSSEGLLREKQQAPSITDKIRNKLKRNEISEAIDTLDEHLSEQDDDELLNQVFMLSGRYNRLLSKQRKGTITEDSANVEAQQIIAALFDLVAEMEES